MRALRVIIMLCGTVILLVIVAACIMYANGTFDHALAPWGLNAHQCVQNVFGTVYCGDEIPRH